MSHFTKDMIGVRGRHLVTDFISPLMSWLSGSLRTPPSGSCVRLRHSGHVKSPVDHTVANDTCDRYHGAQYVKFCSRLVDALCAAEIALRMSILLTYLGITLTCAFALSDKKLSKTFTDIIRYAVPQTNHRRTCETKLLTEVRGVTFLRFGSST
jgi:hypothetical protein